MPESCSEASTAAIRAAREVALSQSNADYTEAQKHHLAGDRARYDAAMEQYHIHRAYADALGWALNPTNIGNPLASLLYHAEERAARDREPTVDEPELVDRPDDNYDYAYGHPYGRVQPPDDIPF
jgi:hypothetical protein